jgi:hypothetical protein
LLEDIEAVDARLSLRGRKKAGEDSHRRRLPGAVLTEEANNLALTHFEGNVLDRDVACVSLSQAFDFDHNFFDGLRAKMLPGGKSLSEYMIPGVAPGAAGRAANRTAAAPK